MRRELPPKAGVDCRRTDDGRILRELPIEDGATPPFKPLVRKREKRLELLLLEPMLEVAAAGLFALLRLPGPLNRRELLSDLMAGVAVMVGVKSERVIVVALLGLKFLRFGLNVGRFREANGRMTGVKVRLRDENVNRDFLRPFSSASSSSSSPSSSPTSSPS